MAVHYLTDKLIRHGALVVNFLFYLTYIVFNVIAVISGSHSFDSLHECVNGTTPNNSAVCFCRQFTADGLSSGGESAMMWLALFGLVFCLFIPLFVEIADSVEALQVVSKWIIFAQNWVNLQLPIFLITNLPLLLYIEAHYNTLKQCAIFNAYPHATTFKEMPGIFKKSGSFFSNQLYDFEWNLVREYNFLLLALLLVIADYYFRRKEVSESLLKRKRRRQVEPNDGAKVQVELAQDESLFFAEFGNICDIALLVSNLTDVQVCSNSDLTKCILVFFASSVFQLSFNRKLKETPCFVLFKLLAQEIPFLGIRAWMIMNGVNTSTVAYFLVQKNIAAVTFSLLHLFIKLLAALCGNTKADYTGLEDISEEPSEVDHVDTSKDASSESLLSSTDQ